MSKAAPTAAPAPAPADYWDARRLLVESDGTIALQVGTGTTPDYYRWPDRTLPQVALWIDETTGYVVVDACPSMIRDDVGTRQLTPVLTAGTPFETSPR